MWSAPKLRDLNLSLNLLKALPIKLEKPHEHGYDSFSSDQFEDDGLGLSDTSSTSSTPKNTPKSKPLSATSGLASTSSISSLGAGMAGEKVCFKIICLNLSSRVCLDIEPSDNILTALAICMRNIN